MYIITETNSRKKSQAPVEKNVLADELFSHSYYSPGKNRKNRTANRFAGGKQRTEPVTQRVTTYQSRNSCVEWLMVD